MRNGLFLALALWSTTGLVRGQAPYSGYPAYPGYGPLPAYPQAMYPPAYPPAYPSMTYGPATPYGQGAQGFAPGMPMTPPGFMPYPQPMLLGGMPVAPSAQLPSARTICPACEASAPAAPNQPQNIQPVSYTSDPMTASGQPYGCGAGSSSGYGDGSGQECYACPDRPAPPMSPCGYRWYGKAEVMYWFLSGQGLPGQTNLGTTSTVPIPREDGVDASSIFPNYDELVKFSNLGSRITLGYWLDSDSCFGIEASVFTMYQATRPTYFSGGPTTGPSATAQANVGEMFGLSTADAGGMLANLTGKNLVSTINLLAGGEANFRVQLAKTMRAHLDLLLGMRWLSLYDYMGVINQQGTVLMESHNNFLGGQVGLEGEITHGRFFLDGWAKIALGVDHQSESLGTSALAATSFTASNGNAGVFVRDEFTTVPEIGLTIGYQLGDHTRLFANYTLVYMNNTARPATTIESYLFGTVPAFHFQDTMFWAQGASLGIEFRF